MGNPSTNCPSLFPIFWGFTHPKASPSLVGPSEQLGTVHERPAERVGVASTGFGFRLWGRGSFGFGFGHLGFTGV